MIAHLSQKKDQAGSQQAGSWPASVLGATIRASAQQQGTKDLMVSIQRANIDC